MKHLKRIFSGASAALLSLSSLLTLGFTGVAHAAVQTCTWTGGGVDNNFSTLANWSGCGGGAPLAGDIIRFDQMQASPVALVNDLNVDLGGLIAAAVTSSNSAGYTVDKLAFAAGAIVSVEPGSTCSVRIPAVAPVDVTGAGDLTIQKEALGWDTYKLVASGNLTIKSIYGAAITSFSAGSSATNVIVASPLGTAGYTTATCSSGGGAGATTGGPATNDLANMTYSAVTIQNGARINLATYAKPMTLGGGTGTENPSVYFQSDTDPDTYAVVTSAKTWSSPLTLTSNASVYVGEKTTVTFTGTIDGVGKSLSKLDYSTGTFTNNATSDNSATPSGTQTNPVKTTNLDGTTTDYVIVVPNETAVLNGQRDGVSVLAGGTLKGTGTVTGNIYISESGLVAPGNSPGCLSSDTLDLSGEYQFELGGTEACTGYDQLKVTNTTATSPTTRFGTNSTIKTVRFNGYTPKQGESFTIIEVAGAQAVSGTFQGLPEGATFEQNGIVFKISYVGGTGNDVVLTVQNQPTAPDTGFALISANPLMTLAVTAGAGLALVGFARRSRPAPARVHTARRRK